MNMSCNPTKEFSTNRMLGGTTFPLIPSLGSKMVLQAFTEYHPKQSGGYLQQNRNNNSINAQYWLQMVLQAFTEYHPKQSGGRLQQNMNNNSIKCPILASNGPPGLYGIPSETIRGSPITFLWGQKCMWTPDHE